MVANSFRMLVRAEGARLYRDLPWRNTRDPYAIWISEVMLQQTQVPRVLTRWDAWLERFPSVFSLAEASAHDVLSAWQGMGYNRRALALKAAAETVASAYDGVFPQDTRELCALPGIGPATAQGIRSFAFNLPGVYLETNVRTVFLHHLFPDAPAVPDRELIPLVEAACPGTEAPFAEPLDEDDTPRAWYYALLDYGVLLKKTVPNPSRRSSTYARQSKFEGSRRQKRAEVVRILLAAQAEGGGLDAGEIRGRLTAFEREAGRAAVDAELVDGILTDLAGEGFCVERDGIWAIA
nr:adenine glycosylase [Collinsella vaginalis]